jgi:branched-chain amino acid transport system substrate-binding protein
MKRALWPVLAFGLAIAASTVAQQGPVPIYGLVELSGTGTTSGTNFDNGVKLAVKEINAAAASSAARSSTRRSTRSRSRRVAKALAQKAIDAGSTS